MPSLCKINKNETVDFSTKLGPYNRNYFEAPAPQHKQHPIGNNVQTEDLVPQQSPWLLLPEILVEILTLQNQAAISEEEEQRTQFMAPRLSYHSNIYDKNFG